MAKRIKYNWSQIGKNVRRIREERGMSRYHLRNKAGISASALSEFERGYSVCRFKTAIKICNTLGVSILTLLEGVWGA